jgi:hypothetical protein
MDNREVFQKAFAIIKNSKSWCKEFYARRGNGDPCESFNPQARAWCSVGALEHASGDFVFELSNPTILEELNAEAYKLAKCPIIEYNDLYTHSAVVKLWTTVGERNGWL